MTKITFVIAGKGKGKTYLTKKKYLIIDKGFLESNVLIFDCFDEYFGIEEIKSHEVSEFCSEKEKRVCRIILKKKMSISEQTKFFLKVLSEFNEGLFIGDAFVEMNKSNELNDAIYKMIINAKNTNKEFDKHLHIILHFHRKESIPKRWLAFDDVIEVKEL